jgi:hypothetical protein
MYQSGRFLLPSVRVGEHRYCYGLWQEYFFKEMKRDPLPFHFYTEHVVNDWIITVGCNQSVRSWFIDELIDHDFIAHAYRNYMVCAISHNTDVSVVPARCYEMLSERVISHYTKNHGWSYSTNVVFFDEILRIDFAEQLAATKLRYTLAPERHSDYRGARLIMQRYRK